MKKLIVFGALAAAAVLVVTLAGCSSSSSSSAAASSASASASASTSASTASESASASAASSESSLGIANPWTTVASAEEAAKGAGLDGFTVPDAPAIGDTVWQAPTFSYTTDVAQVNWDAGAADAYARKSKNLSGQGLSGDYNAYSFEAVTEVTIDGQAVEVNCSGVEDDVISECAWSGNFRIDSTLKRSDGAYLIMVWDIYPELPAGVEFETEDGMQMISIDPLFGSEEYLVLTIPGTPADVIPEFVKNEIGINYPGQDCSDFITLTREYDGWGYYEEK